MVVAPASAEDYPRGELFAGYQFSHIGGPTGHGWSIAINGNFNRWFGVEADVSDPHPGLYAPHHLYLSGPIFTSRTKHINGFANVLMESCGYAMGNSFYAEFGAGVDANIMKHLAFRVIQADWLAVKYSGLTDTRNGRACAGFVFRF